MIETLLSSEFVPAQLMATLKKLDTTLNIHRLIETLQKNTANPDRASQSATIMKVTNLHTGTLVLHCNEHGNISLKAPDSARASPLLYSVPGKSFLFAINHQSFPVQLYERQLDQLIPAQKITVDSDNPLFIDGAMNLFDSNPEGVGHQAFVGSINLPDRGKDIDVFDRHSLRKIAWFPHDDSAARYLVSLELLEAVNDPQAAKVAEELIYHYHPAVAWKAFQVIQNVDPIAAQRHVPLLRKLQHTRLNYLLDQQGAAA